MLDYLDAVPVGIGDPDVDLFVQGSVGVTDKMLKKAQKKGGKIITEATFLDLIGYRKQPV